MLTRNKRITQHNVACCVSRFVLYKALAFRYCGGRFPLVEWSWLLYLDTIGSNSLCPRHLFRNDAAVSLSWTRYQTRKKNESSLKFSEAYRVNLSPSILHWLDFTFSGSVTIMKTLVVFWFQICAFTLGIEGLVRSLWFPCFFLFIDKIEVKEGEGFLATQRIEDNSSSRLTPKDPGPPAGALGTMFTSNSHRDKTNERGHKPVKKKSKKFETKKKSFRCDIE